MDNMNLADIAAVTRDDNFGGSGAWVLIILFALIFGWGGNGFGGGNALQQADLQRAIDLNSIQNGQAEIMADVQRTNYEQIGATKDAAYNNLSEIRDIQSAMSLGFANQQKCCCETLRAIDGVNYNGAINTAQINANTTAQTQKILDAIAGNRMADMQSQINQLQLQSALCGVVRYPNATTYNAGTSCFSNCGCGCGSI